MALKGQESLLQAGSARRPFSGPAHTHDLLMLLRQLFDRDTCSYTYLLSDDPSGIAAVIDPVCGHTDEVLALLAESRLRLAWSLETHTHADHVTGGGTLRRRTGARMVVHAAANASTCADLAVRDGDRVPIGALAL